MYIQLGLHVRVQTFTYKLTQTYYTNGMSSYHSLHITEGQKLCYHIRFRLSGSIQQAVRYIPIREARLHLLFVAPYRLRIIYTFTFGAVDCRANHAFSCSKSWEGKLLNLLATYLLTRKLGLRESICLNGQRKRGSNSKGNVSLTQFSR